VKNLNFQVDNLLLCENENKSEPQGGQLIIQLP
jgi:hypothetical protein